MNDKLRPSIGVDPLMAAPPVPSKQLTEQQKRFHLAIQRAREAEMGEIKLSPKETRRVFSGSIKKDTPTMTPTIGTPKKGNSPKSLDTKTQMTAVKTGSTKDIEKTGANDLKEPSTAIASAKPDPLNSKITNNHTVDDEKLTTTNSNDFDLKKFEKLTTRSSNDSELRLNDDRDQRELLILDTVLYETALIGKAEVVNEEINVEVINGDVVEKPEIIEFLIGIQDIQDALPPVKPESVKKVKSDTSIHKQILQLAQETDTSTDVAPAPKDFAQTPSNIFQELYRASGSPWDSPGTTKASPGTIKASPSTIKASPSTMKASPSTIKASPSTVKVSPNVLMASPNIRESPTTPTKSVYPLSPTTPKITSPQRVVLRITPQGTPNASLARELAATSELSSKLESEVELSKNSLTSEHEDDLLQDSSRLHAPQVPAPAEVPHNVPLSRRPPPLDFVQKSPLFEQSQKSLPLEPPQKTLLAEPKSPLELGLPHKARPALGLPHMPVPQGLPPKSLVLGLPQRTVAENDLAKRWQARRNSVDNKPDKLDQVPPRLARRGISNPITKEIATVSFTDINLSKELPAIKDDGVLSNPALQPVMEVEQEKYNVFKGFGEANPIKDFEFILGVPEKFRSDGPTPPAKDIVHNNEQGKLAKHDRFELKLNEKLLNDEPIGPIPPPKETKRSGRSMATIQEPAGTENLTLSPPRTTLAPAKTPPHASFISTLSPHRVTLDPAKSPSSAALQATRSPTTALSEPATTPPAVPIKTSSSPPREPLQQLSTPKLTAAPFKKMSVSPPPRLSLPDVKRSNSPAMKFWPELKRTVSPNKSLPELRKPVSPSKSLPEIKKSPVTPSRVTSAHVKTTTLEPPPRDFNELINQPVKDFSDLIKGPIKDFSDIIKAPIKDFSDLLRDPDDDDVTPVASTAFPVVVSQVDPVVVPTVDPAADPKAVNDTKKPMPKGILKYAEAYPEVPVKELPLPTVTSEGKDRLAPSKSNEKAKKKSSRYRSSILRSFSFKKQNEKPKREDPRLNRYSVTFAEDGEPEVANTYAHDMDTKSTRDYMINEINKAKEEQKLAQEEQKLAQEEQKLAQEEQKMADDSDISNKENFDHGDLQSPSKNDNSNLETAALTEFSKRVAAKKQENVSSSRGRRFLIMDRQENKLDKLLLVWSSTSPPKRKYSRFEKSGDVGRKGSLSSKLSLDYASNEMMPKQSLDTSYNLSKLGKHGHLKHMQALAQLEERLPLRSNTIKVKIYVEVYLEKSEKFESEIIAFRMKKDRLRNLNELNNLIIFRLLELKQDININNLRLLMVFKDKNLKPIVLKLSVDAKERGEEQAFYFNDMGLLFDYVMLKDKLYVKAQV